MVDQAEGLMSVAAGLLAYALIVQAMLAAVLLLAQFTVLQWRALRTLIQESSGPVGSPRTLPAPAREVHQARGEPAPTIQIGGGLKKW